jgi:hypothetical protein
MVCLTVALPIGGLLREEVPLRSARENKLNSHMQQSCNFVWERHGHTAWGVKGGSRGSRQPQAARHAGPGETLGSPW